MRRFSFQPLRSHHARMSLAWLAIVSIAGVVLFASFWLGDRAQQAAIDGLSTYSLPRSPPRQ
jgi:hypothetical protein